MALGPSGTICVSLYNSRKKPGKRIVSNQDQRIHIRATPITESHASIGNEENIISIVVK